MLQGQIFHVKNYFKHTHVKIVESIYSVLFLCGLFYLLINPTYNNQTHVIYTSFFSLCYEIYIIKKNENLCVYGRFSRKCHGS